MVARLHHSPAGCVMCDFKPGDEVVCVKDGRTGVTRKGKAYVVEAVFLHPSSGPSLALIGIPVRVRGYYWGHNPDRFRKVARRNDSLSIEAFLTIKPGFEEPKRAPAKKRERV